MGFTHAALAHASGVTPMTLNRIERGYAPGHMAVTVLMMPLAYGPEVRDLLLAGSVDPDALDDLSAPTDALSRIDVVPEAYRRRSIFARRVSTGLPPLVRPRSFVFCATGPHEDGLALVEFVRRGLMAVRFARRRDDVWELRETPRGAPVEVPASRVKRVSCVLYDARKLLALLVAIAVG